MIEAIDHVNLIVDDLDAMTSFYRDVFGLAVTKRVTIRGRWIEELTGYERVEADVAYLEANEGPGIELIRYCSPEGSRPAGLGEPNVGGMRHIAFRVADVDATTAALERQGVRFLSAPQDVPPQQVKYSTGKKLVYCLDPEGNLLELCSYGPGA